MAGTKVKVTQGKSTVSPPPTGLIFCNLRSRFDLRQVELVFLLVVVIFFVFSIRGLKAMQVKKKLVG